MPALNLEHTWRTSMKSEKVAASHKYTKYTHKNMADCQLGVSQPLTMRRHIIGASKGHVRAINPYIFLLQEVVYLALSLC